VGWYLCTLFWLWLLFPFIPIPQFCSSDPWTSVVSLYCVSVLGFLAFAGFTNMNTRALPPLRVCEFLMGACITFTLEKPVNGWLVLAGLLGFLGYWILTRAMPDLFAQEDVSLICALWPAIRSWRPDPSSLLSSFSIVWCGTHFFSPLVFPLSPLATWKSPLDYIKISASNRSHSPSDRTHRARIVFI
jgi:hypothetical protein